MTTATFALYGFIRLAPTQDCIGIPVFRNWGMNHAWVSEMDADLKITRFLDLLPDQRYMIEPLPAHFQKSYSPGDAAPIPFLTSGRATVISGDADPSSIAFESEIADAVRSLLRKARSGYFRTAFERKKFRESDLPPSNRIFSGRRAELALFQKSVFSIPSGKAKLLVFYGVGGQGKTALCRELLRKTDSSLEPSYAFLRRALLDLHGRPKTDPDLLLVWIRNAFADADVDCPCFDLALASMWEGTRSEEAFPKLTKPWLARPLKAIKGASDQGAPKAEGWLHSDQAQEMLGDAVSEIPGVGFALKRLGGWAIEKGKRAYLERTREHLQRLYQDGKLKPAHELSKLLPWMLAQDLNFHLAHNPNDRFVLFIDEYEKVFDQGGAGARWRDNPFDDHMRSFIQETNGLLAVFFSRERLAWEDHPDWRDDLKGNQHLLDGLADRDADEFLRAIPIADSAIRAAIIDGARERPEKQALVYPLMLDLQVDHWRALTARDDVMPQRFRLEAESFEARRIELVNRVLRDYGDGLQATIERLSVAQRFDRDAFRHVVETFHTGLPLDSFERIADMSFVTRATDGFLTLHNSLRATIREQLNEEKRNSSIEALLDHFSQRARVASHFDLDAQKLAALNEAAHLRRRQGLEGYVQWLAQATEPLLVGAYYAAATSLWREAATAAEQTLGAERPETALSLSNLAYLIQAQGDYAGAEPLYERALAISEKTLGPEHPETVQSLNNLGELLQAKGDYAAAKALIERALTIGERALGPEHPDTALGLNNLAQLLRAQADFGGAKPLYERALAIRERALGPEHPSTAMSLNNLAELLRAQGDYVRAKPLYERTLAIYEKALGPEHPHTATSLNNLASLLYAQGDFAGAKRLYERALAIREKALGPEHPDTATSLNNLAGLLKAQGDYVGAKPLYERALAICEKTLGPEHPTTKTIRANLESLGRG